MKSYPLAEDLTGVLAVALTDMVSAMLSPKGLLCFAIWTSTSLGTTHNLFSFRIGSMEFTPSGCITFLLFSGALAYLCANSSVCWEIAKKNYRVYLLFLLLLAMRVIDAPQMGTGAKEFVLMATPLAVGLVAAIAMNKGLSARWIEKQLLLTPLAVIAVLIFQAVAGTAKYDDYGLLSVFGKGPIALFGLPIYALSLSHWRYETGKGWYRWATPLSLGLILSTVERMASAVAVLVLLPARYLLFKPRVIRSAVIAAVAASAVALLLLQVPVVRYRFFGDKENPVFSGDDEIINTTGRAEIWYLTALHALERPFWGHGTGSAEVFVTETIPVLQHPHNEYLRIYHDLGVLGILLFVGAWFGRLRLHFKQWRKVEGTPALAQPQMAATLAVLAFVLLFLTDNILIATFVQMPAFLLFAIADTSFSGARNASTAACE